MQGGQLLQSEPEMVSFTVLIISDISEQKFEISSQSPYLAYESSRIALPVQGVRTKPSKSKSRMPKSPKLKSCDKVFYVEVSKSKSPKLLTNVIGLKK